MIKHFLFKNLRRVLLKMIKIVKGDLFSSTDESLCHCVSEDFKMGKGIALTFRKKFGNVDYLKNQNKKVGEVAVLEFEDLVIFYLVTKKYYYGKPTYSSLRQCLIEMRDIMVENKIKTLSMPKIGAGLDRLEWPKVQKIIEDVFCEAFCRDEVRITVYEL